MTETLEYKGYQASVDFEDGKIVIQVLHVRDLLIGECASAGEVEATLHELIDGYVTDCERIGKDPDKPFSGTFNVRISPELHKLCAKLAATEQISLNEVVGRALEKAVGAAATTKANVRSDWDSFAPTLMRGRRLRVRIERAEGRSRDEKMRKGVIAAWTDSDSNKGRR